MWPEEEECSEDTECQIDEKAQGGEVDIELPVAHAEREDLEERQGACCEYIERPHVEERAFFPSPERADVACPKMAPAGAVPEMVPYMKGVAARSLKDFALKERLIGDVYVLATDEPLDQLSGVISGKRAEIDPGK